MGLGEEASVASDSGDDACKVIMRHMMEYAQSVPGRCQIGYQAHIPGAGS